MLNIDNESYFIKSKASQISKKFEFLFKSKSYNPDDYFGKEVWFLRENKFFASLLSETNTPQKKNLQSSKLFELIINLNHNHNLSNLSVSVKDFIENITHLLIESKSKIDLCETNIKNNDLRRKINQIKYETRLLSEMIKSNKKNDQYSSSIKISLVSMKDFFSGKYKVSIAINSEFDKDDVNELNKEEKNNLDKNNPNNAFDIFEEKILKSNKEYFIIKDGEDGFDYEDESYKNINRGRQEDNSFEEYPFTCLDKELPEYVTDKKNSGTTFSSFKVLINSIYGDYESKNNFLFTFLINWVDELCDLNNNTITKYFDLQVKNRIDKNEKSVKLKFDILLDNLTRLAILSRVQELISIVVESKLNEELFIEEILFDYFPEIKESVNKILMQEEEPRDNCCFCNIY